MTARGPKEERRAGKYADHILEAIRMIEGYVRRHNFNEFRAASEAGDLEADGVERRLEILSEASRRLPDPLKATELDIDWRDIAALGNQLRHAYHRTDREVLWKICTEDLPALKLAVERIKSRL